MLTTSYSTRFKKDLIKGKKQQRNLKILTLVMENLIHRKPLPKELNDHPLRGKWKGYRDCHIEPDWVLIYRLSDQNVHFERVGSHADLFG
ncbi:MAG: type II toxin-antitoxin system YafQ family toxin [Chlamydiia bacterium]|nr:type II toxin-antitoxin system YafQ family toxin [Chlamydiia bacterium]